MAVGAVLQSGCGRKRQESYQCLMQNVFQVRDLNDALTVTYCTSIVGFSLVMRFVDNKSNRIDKQQETDVKFNL